MPTRTPSRNVQLASADISQDDIDEVLDVLRSGRLALGPKVKAFEQAVADYVGVKHALAVSSGTAGLHVVLASLGVGPGDEVIVPSFTFAASVNAILLVGATPVFCDIEPVTYNLDPEDVERRVTERTKAIMAVDVFGHPADWDALMRIARRYGLFLVDDSCEALGSDYKGRKVGSFADASVFAFYPNKQITTGEGGMIVTNSDHVAMMAASIRNQGRNVMGAWLEHERLGFNYRMDEMSAALGASQMRRLDAFVADRQRVVDLYAEALAGVPGVRVPQTQGDVRVSWFVYVVLLDRGIDRDAVMAELDAEGVPNRAYFPALHHQPYLRHLVPDRVHLSVTEDIAARTVSLPFHTKLTEDEVAYVASRLAACLERVATAA